jgi:hypothetical protein
VDHLAAKAVAFLRDDANISPSKKLRFFFPYRLLNMKSTLLLLRYRSTQDLESLIASGLSP